MSIPRWGPGTVVKTRVVTPILLRELLLSSEGRHSQNPGDRSREGSKRYLSLGWTLGRKVLPDGERGSWVPDLGVWDPTVPGEYSSSTDNPHRTGV